MLAGPQALHLLIEKDAVQGGQETPASFDLFLLPGEGGVSGGAILHGTMCCLAHQLPLPFLLRNKGGIGDRCEGVCYSNEGEEMLGGHTQYLVSW